MLGQKLMMFFALLPSPYRSTLKTGAIDLSEERGLVPGYGNFALFPKKWQSLRSFGGVQGLSLIHI